MATVAGKGQTHYSLEDKARALAEYRLTGSYSCAARLVGCSHSQVIEWEKALSEIDRDRQTKKTREWLEVEERAEELVESRRVALDEAFNVALELQVRDLDGAEFRDRTGFLKISGEKKRLAQGKPTSIVGKPDEIDKEIDRMLGEYVEKQKERQARHRQR